MRPTVMTRAATGRRLGWLIYSFVIGLVLVVAKATNRVNGIPILRLNPGLDGELRFDYRHEFIRRGLLGEVLRQLHYPTGGFAQFLVGGAGDCGGAGLVVPPLGSAPAPPGRAAPPGA